MKRRTLEDICAYVMYICPSLIRPGTHVYIIHDFLHQTWASNNTILDVELPQPAISGLTVRLPSFAVSSVILMLS